MRGTRRGYLFNWLKSDRERGEVLVGLRGPKHGYHIFYLSEAEMNRLVRSYLDTVLGPTGLPGPGETRKRVGSGDLVSAPSHPTTRQEITS